MSEDKADARVAELRQELSAEQTRGYPTPREATLLEELDAALVREGAEAPERLAVLDRLFKVRVRLSSPPSDLIGIAHALGEVHSVQGDGTQAEAWFRRAVVMGGGEAGAEASRKALAASLRQQNLFGKAFEVEIPATATVRISQPGDGTVSLEWVELARTYEDDGDLERAFACLIRALVIKEDDFGPDHWDTAKRLTDLAAFLERRERWDEALELRLRAIAVFEATDDSRLWVAYGHRDLARVAASRDLPEDAERHWRSAVAALAPVAADSKSQKLVLGEIRDEFAVFLHQQDRFADSVAELTLAAEIWRTMQHHEDNLARSFFGIGMNQMCLRRYDEAISAFEGLADVQGSRHGADHDDVVWARQRIEEARNLMATGTGE